MESLVGFLDREGSGDAELTDCDGRGQTWPPTRRPNIEPIVAVVAGFPVWTDESLAKLARDRSNSVALLRAYEDSPDTFLSKLGGQFSLCVVDNRHRRCLLAVDRFGIGQLFWSRQSDGAIYFSSKLSELAERLPADLQINDQSLYNYVYFHCIPSPNTIWNGVYKLGPAEQIVCHRRKEISSRYWEPNFSRVDGRSAAPSEILDTLRNAVSRSTVSPDTAAFLSGGLDSSTICGLFQEQTTDKAKAFTVSFDHDDYDELAYARLASRHFGLDHHVVNANADATLENLNRIFAALDEPFGNSSIVPTFLCANAAQQSGIVNLLAGDGGDELFAGNTRYAKQGLFEKYLRLPHGLRTSFLEPLFCGLLGNVSATPIRKLRRYIEQARIMLPARLETYNHLEIWGPHRVFSDDLVAAVDPHHPLSLMEARYREPVDADTLDRMLFLDWKFTLADNDLRKVTSMCNLAGVQVQFPFLDNDVVDVSTRIPSRQKLRGNELRHFYKKATSHYLPDQILNKSKHGFGLPFGEWLKTSKDLQETIYDHLGDLKRRNWVRREFIDELIDHHRKGHAGFYGEAVWVFTALEIWCKTHSV